MFQGSAHGCHSRTSSVGKRGSCNSGRVGSSGECPTQGCSVNRCPKRSETGCCGATETCGAKDV